MKMKENEKQPCFLWWAIPPDVISIFATIPHIQCFEWHTNGRTAMGLPRL